MVVVAIKSFARADFGGPNIAVNRAIVGVEAIFEPTSKAPVN
jgi:hypothetical protein